jgi:hypothetical protein
MSALGKPGDTSFGGKQLSRSLVCLVVIALQPDRQILDTVGCPAQLDKLLLDGCPAFGNLLTASLLQSRQRDVHVPSDLNQLRRTDADQEAGGWFQFLDHAGEGVVDGDIRARDEKDSLPGFDEVCDRPAQNLRLAGARWPPDEAEAGCPARGICLALLSIERTVHRWRQRSEPPMRERIRQPGVAQLRQTVPKRFDEVGGWPSQRPEAKVVLDDVGRDPNPENLSLQYSIEHSIPVALRFGWSLLAQSQCVQFLGDGPLPCTPKVHDERALSLGPCHADLLPPRGPDARWYRSQPGVDGTAHLVPLIRHAHSNIRRKVTLVTMSLYGQDGTGVRLGCGLLRRWIASTIAIGSQERFPTWQGGHGTGRGCPAVPGDDTCRAGSSAPNGPSA